MDYLLMPADSIRYTTQGDYACSYCGYLIPVNSRNELQEWCSTTVAGMFCSESHAIAGECDLNYLRKFAYAYNKGE
jgi:hypothetical protein